MERDRDKYLRDGARPTALVVSEVLIYREGIAAGLNRLGDIDVIATVPVNELRAALAGHPVQIIFLDVSHPRSRECARVAQAISPGLQLIGFGMTSEDEGLAGAEAGVTAFVDHEGTIDDLNEAAKCAMKGVPVCPPRLTTRLLERINQLASCSRIDPDSPLTHRERQIHGLLQQGLSNKEIAGALNISPATVKNHVHMILEKLNVPKRGLIMLDATRPAAGPANFVAR